MKNIINFLQNKLNLLCDEYNLSRIKVVFNSSLLKGNKENKKYIIGQCDPENKRIVLNEKILLENDSEYIILTALYHEFRHYWQYKNHNDVYRWWLSQSNRTTYQKYYNTKFCSIEEDARMFGFSLGCYSREDLLEQYSVDFLSYLIKNPSQIELLLEVLV